VSAHDAKVRTGINRSSMKGSLQAQVWFYSEQALKPDHELVAFYERTVPALDTGQTTPVLPETTIPTPEPPPMPTPDTMAGDVETIIQALAHRRAMPS
jgi:hypothetical protein